MRACVRAAVEAAQREKNVRSLMPSHSKMLSVGPLFCNKQSVVYHCWRETGNKSGQQICGRQRARARSAYAFQWQSTNGINLTSTELEMVLRQRNWCEIYFDRSPNDDDDEWTNKIVNMYMPSALLRVFAVVNRFPESISPAPNWLGCWWNEANTRQELESDRADHSRLNTVYECTFHLFARNCVCNVYVSGRFVSHFGHCSPKLRAATPAAEPSSTDII